MPAASDPYVTLGVSPTVSDQELRSVYRRLVQQHHPDHNGGSVASARRFEEIQLAYAAAREQRASGRPTTTRRTTPPPRPTHPSDLDERMAAMEFELREAQRKREQQLREERQRSAQRVREREAQQARERAAREAARAASPDNPRRASDEELGYFSTDDSFGKILSDARDELSDRFSHAREHPVVQRVSDLIDGLDDLVSQVDRRKPRDG